MMLRALGALLLGLVAATPLLAVEIRQWERLPIAIALVVGEERVIFVNQNVRVGLPRALQTRLRVQSTGGTLYLLAREPIEPSRVQLQNMDTGEVMLLDIAAREGTPEQAPLEPIRIVAAPRPDEHVTAAAGVDTPGDERDEEQATIERPATPLPVALTRYAAQLLYAPLRAVEAQPGIAQVKVDRALELDTLLPTQPVEARVLGAWRLHDLIVTAVKLRNTSAQPVELDPRELMGDFVTATFQHAGLGHRGDPSDTTTLYLVTRGRGLAEAILPAGVGRIDPQEGPRER